MPESDRVLPDASVLIDYFAGVERAVKALVEPIRRDRIVLCGTIVQEVLQGAHNERELAKLDDELALWPVEPETTADFSEAARMYARLRWKGITVPASDCLIAAVAKRREYQICATDPHFEKIPGLRLLKV